MLACKQQGVGDVQRSPARRRGTLAALVAQGPLEAELGLLPPQMSVLASSPCMRAIDNSGRTPAQPIAGTSKQEPSWSAIMCAHVTCLCDRLCQQAVPGMQSEHTQQAKPVQLSILTRPLCPYNVRLWPLVPHHLCEITHKRQRGRARKCSHGPYSSCRVAPRITRLHSR